MTGAQKKIDVYKMTDSKKKIDEYEMTGLSQEN